MLTRLVGSAIVAGTLAFAAIPAEAHGSVSLSLGVGIPVGVGFGYAPPVYVGPPVVYGPPRPRVFLPPVPVFYGPRYGYSAEWYRHHPGWNGHWDHYHGRPF